VVLVVVGAARQQEKIWPVLVAEPLDVVDEIALGSVSSFSIRSFSPYRISHVQFEPNSSVTRSISLTRCSNVVLFGSP